MNNDDDGDGLPKELEEEEQILWIEVALVELVVGMALHLFVDVAKDVLKFIGNLRAHTPLI